MSKESCHAVSDYQVKAWYESLLSEPSVDTAIIATNVQLNELRIGVKLKQIEPFEIQFNDITITCNSNGTLNNWPKGFFDIEDNQLDILTNNLSTRID